MVELGGAWWSVVERGKSVKFYVNDGIITLNRIIPNKELYSSFLWLIIYHGEGSWYA